MNSRRREEELTLELLTVIEQRSDVTQRHLASRMGVALGLTNSYLKRCARKGLIKVQQAPANRYLYYLTPKGFAEKSRLTADYLSFSFRFYRRACTSCAQTLSDAKARGWHRLGLYGASDLAEIAALQALECGVEVVCLCDPAGRRQQFLSYSVVRSMDEAPPIDAWLFTALENARIGFEEACLNSAGVPVLAPSLLKLDALHSETE